MTKLSCAYATASADAIAEFACSHFDLEPIASCRLLRRGFNDLYAIAAGDRRWVLRVSRSGRRRRSDLEYEAGLLAHLSSQHVPVVTALVGRNGHYAQAASYAEGTRFALLFNFIPGRDPEEQPSDMYAQGETLARMHEAATGFASRHDRFHLGLDHLLGRALAALDPLLDDRPEDRAYLATIADRLGKRIESRASALSWGICHGDSHGFNARIGAGGVATLLDFDDGGPGWLSYDLATWLWSARAFAPARRELWKAFIDGYRGRFQIASSDLEAVSVFVPTRHIWLLGEYAAGSAGWGTSWLGPWFDRQIAFLKSWEDEELADPLGLG
jgi:Ser/Thr protein kinase RdoA (MazF antagonist)